MNINEIEKMFYSGKISNRQMSAKIKKAANEYGWNSDQVTRLREIYQER